MKKLVFACMILVMLCFIGCDYTQQQNSAPEQQTQPTVQTTVPEPTQCKHEILSEAPSLQYFGPDYGGSCEDPMRVYHKCLECGEDVYVKDVSTGAVCTEMSYSKVVTKQPTCTEEGTYTFECFHCKKVRERSIPSNGHRYYYFWGEDVPRCLDCRTVQEDACNHEYVTGLEQDYRGDYPGVRFHLCKNCNAETFEIFDKEGNYDLRLVKDTLSAQLQALGFQILEDYTRSSHETVYVKKDMLQLKYANSEKTPQQLIERGYELIDLMVSGYDFGPAGVDPSNYYAWVDLVFVHDALSYGICLKICVMV